MISKVPIEVPRRPEPDEDTICLECHQPTPMPSAKQQIRFCTSPDGVRIAYATMGTGPPLVKAANWLSHLEFDWNSPVWEE